jgi:antitoxin component YwqK of YwqJK toxin-antitoxin module
VLNGPTTTYYETGVMQAELTYVDGLLDGAVKEYFPSGRVAATYAYKAGRKHGPAAVYNEAGIVEKRLTYQHDEIASEEAGP